MPPLLIQDLSGYGTPAQAKLLINSFLQNRPETFRINTLKTDEEQLLQILQKSKIPFSKAPHLELSYFFGDVSTKKVQSHSAYQEGLIYMQNLASQVPALVLDPKPDEKIVDLCASPGGKTSQIAALMGNCGELDACEPDKIRFERLVHNLNHLGVEATTHHLSAEKFLWGLGSNQVDKVLIDAPCSGSGTFHVNRPQDYRHWSRDFVNKMVGIQTRILKAAAPAIKNGGTLVYSTCSLSIEENEQVIADFLTNHPQFTTVETDPDDKIHLKRFASQPLVSRFKSSAIRDSLMRTRRIFPSELFEGFYIAKLTKEG